MFPGASREQTLPGNGIDYLLALGPTASLPRGSRPRLALRAAGSFLTHCSDPVPSITLGTPHPVLFTPRILTR